MGRQTVGFCSHNDEPRAPSLSFYLPLLPFQRNRYASPAQPGPLPSQGHFSLSLFSSYHLYLSSSCLLSFLYPTRNTLPFFNKQTKPALGSSFPSISCPVSLFLLPPSIQQDWIMDHLHLPLFAWPQHSSGNAPSEATWGLPSHTQLGTCPAQVHTLGFN